MKPSDRARLTAALRDLVAQFALDLREKLRGLAPDSAETRAQALRLHADERVAEDFDVWTDLLARRAAVLWVLKSVYVRVLEDRGLLAPGRLLDPEAQLLFERLAPHLGETAFLRWIYRDLASPRGGLPELFSPQPAEVAAPSDALSRALIAFWRHKDADTGAHYSFATERFQGELMGDLYQELDPVVKDRFALCQTPDFVRAFILDRTLTPAIAAYGADQVRLIDPACGSGHFLIDGLERLFTATLAQHPDWSRPKLAAHALERVVGIDLNDYACALARTRLVMTAAELAGVSTLSEAGPFHPHVYWADGLEQVERDTPKRPVQTDLFTTVDEPPRATLTRSDVRAALKPILAKKFHVVVANPPYITEKDDARKDYHREKVGREQRYVSAYRQYSLGSPFTERCFQLAAKDGFVGLITGNNFMKREFGRPLIEQVLAKLDLTLVVDTSQAYIPFHGTPTVLLFGRNRRPVGNVVRAVMGKRGESGTPADPAQGRVWSSIAAGWETLGFENEYVSVADMPRETLGKHPWSLGGGGAAELKARVQDAASVRLLEIVEEVGAVSVIRADDAYELPLGCALGGIPAQWTRRHIAGEDIRDWRIAASAGVVFPYDDAGQGVSELHSSLHSRLWPYRTLLAGRVAFGKTQIERGLPWYEYSMLFAGRFASKLLLVFPNVATHNHVALLREAAVVNSKAPVIKLPSGATEDDHLALLGLLNSSTACFWMKQVFHNKGGGTDSGKWQSDPAKIAYEFTATGLEAFPVPSFGVEQARLVDLARRLDAMATERANCLAKAVPGVDELPPVSATILRAAIADAESLEEILLRRQVALQEELDWLAYRLYGLTELSVMLDPEVLGQGPGVQIGVRPYEILQARSGRVDGVDSQPLLSALPADTAVEVVEVWSQRIAELERSSALQLIEEERYKRRWLLTPKYLAGRVETFADRLGPRLNGLLGDLVEAAARKRDRPFDVQRLAADLQDDARFSALAEVLTGRHDYGHLELVRSLVVEDAVPNHPHHRYSRSGRVKHAAWERTWADQRLEDEGHAVVPAVPPSYAQPDFVSRRVFELRGKLDVPKERFVAFTEVPGRGAGETLYGWAGWTALERVKALLGRDEALEDAGVPLADRIGVLDSAWRLLPEVAREDGAAATRLRAELQAVVGPEGPSREQVEDWAQRFPPPRAARGAAGAKKARRAAAAAAADTEHEEDDA